MQENLMKFGKGFRQKKKNKIVQSDENRKYVREHLFCRKESGMLDVIDREYDIVHASGGEKDGVSESG